MDFDNYVNSSFISNSLKFEKINLKHFSKIEIFKMTKRELWDFFSSKSEYSSLKKDELGRFIFRNSSVEITSKPTVSDFLFQKGFQPFYPKGKSFAVSLSHDIDHLFFPNFLYGKRLRQSVKEAMKFNWNSSVRYLNPNDRINPYFNIEKILEIEEKLGINSTFYFLSLRPGDRDFNFKTEEISDLFGKIIKQGSEVGLHGGHDAFFDLERLNIEKNELEKSAKIKVKGYRNHYLKFNVPNTWSILERAEFNYDTTFGFPDHPGFRNGMCYPFFPYDLDQGKFLDILEIPLVMMDASFIYHLKWKPEEVVNLGKKLIDQIQSIQGVVTILWHNNYYIKPWDKVLAELIDYCKEKDPWFCTGQELNDWWRKNKFCEKYFLYGLEPY